MHRVDKVIQLVTWVYLTQRRSENLILIKFGRLSLGLKEVIKKLCMAPAQILLFHRIYKLHTGLNESQAEDVNLRIRRPLR